MAENDSINKTDILTRDGMANIIYQTVVCYEPSSITTNGLWQGEKPLNFSLPLFILQLMVIVVTNQVCIILLKPLRQPRVVAEIISGVVLGGYGFGEYDWFAQNIFPLKSTMVLDTMANIGVLYYMFLVGIEMDVSMIKHSDRQTLAMVVFGLLLPMVIYVGIEWLILLYYKDDSFDHMNIMFFSVIASFTGFPVLSRILVELKLFNTELGRKTLSAALVLDLCGWFLVAIYVGWVENYETPEKLYIPIVGSIGFALICIMVIRPAIMWVINRTPEGENFNELHLCFIFTGVIICGFITESISTNFVFGGFVFGLIIPNGQLGTVLMEKIDDFVTTILLPLYFTINGMKFGIWSPERTPGYKYYDLWQISAFLITNAIKMLGTFLVGLYFDMQMHEALSFGLVMNTKGVIEVIALNVGINNWLNGGFYPSAIGTAMISIVLVTSIATPAISLLYMTSKQLSLYKHTTMQKAKMDVELKILVCVYTLRDVSIITDLLKASNATGISPIHVYALHLVELNNRASSMLIVHNATKIGNWHNKSSRTQTQSEPIVKALENYAQNETNVILEPFTVISPYATIHEDIGNFVKEKHINLTIVPFHKQQTVDGSMESSNPALRQVNQYILANTPCSIGILIHKGLGGFASQDFSNIVVIFMGGPDDREALAYGWRMAEQPGVNLTIMRFIPGDNIKVNTDLDHEVQLDDEYIGEFRLKTAGHKAFAFKENVVNNTEDIVTTIRGMETIHDLYIIGRRQALESSLIAGLNDFIENPELGPIGDLLASSDFTTTISVLVVQQYAGK